MAFPKLIQDHLGQQVPPKITISGVALPPITPAPFIIQIPKQKGSQEFYLNLFGVCLLAGFLSALQLPAIWIIGWIALGSLLTLVYDALLARSNHRRSTIVLAPPSSKPSNNQRSPIYHSIPTQLNPPLAPIEWEKVLEHKVVRSNVVSTAPQGASEASFLARLQKYFGPAADWGRAYAIPQSDFSYSSDLEIFIGGLGIQIEIDEPYFGKIQEPHHCVDQGKDERRDLFFLGYNWVIIRFSEMQVVRYPVECCSVIAKVLLELTNDHSQWLDLSLQAGNLPIDPCWDLQASQEMASQNYRASYLND